MKMIDNLINIISDKNVDSEFVKEIAQCTQFSLVSKVELSREYIDLLLDIILSLFDFLETPKKMIFSMPYYYEYYIWMYLFLEKYEPNRKETKEIYENIYMLLSSNIVIESEKNKYQELSINLFKKSSLDEIKNFFDKKMEKIIKHPLTMPILNFEEICICIYLDIKYIYDYMDKFMFFYVCADKYCEYTLCKLYSRGNIVLQLNQESNFLKLFITEVV